jgi:hypothetical protein
MPEIAEAEALLATLAETEDNRLRGRMLDDTRHERTRSKELQAPNAIMPR